MNNPNRIRRQLRFLLTVVAVIVALLTIFTNGSFYIVGTCLLAGSVAAFFGLHAAFCRCPHCGRRLPISGDESHVCQYCGQDLLPSRQRETYSGLYYQEQ